MRRALRSCSPLADAAAASVLAAAAAFALPDLSSRPPTSRRDETRQDKTRQHLSEVRCSFRKRGGERQKRKER